MKNKGLIYYYSNTGNTRLACESIAHKITDVSWDFCNIKTDEPVNHRDYQIIGFATYTDAWDVPKYFKEYLLKIPRGNNLPAFILNTYGATSVHTLKILEQVVQDRGYKIIAGFSLHMPENYPPMIAIGMGNPQAPNKKELQNFINFTKDLQEKCKKINNHENIEPAVIDIGLKKYLPHYPQKLITKIMGKKMVDESKCKKCGLCVRSCPYQAIKLNPYPEFDDAKCCYCWNCYNQCPCQAIYTTHFKKSRYTRPNWETRDKLL